MLTLENKLGIFTPSTGKNDRPISRDELADRINIVDHKLTGLFGGCTNLAPSIGNYNGDNGLIKEDVILQLSWCTKEAYNDHYGLILAWASYLCREWYQQTVAILDNNFHLHLISENDYKSEWSKIIVPPVIFLEAIGVNDSRGISFYDNGYTVGGAQYELENGHKAISNKDNFQYPEGINPDTYPDLFWDPKDSQ